jgi:hypothetical protein
MSLPKRVILPIFTQRMILNIINSNKKQTKNIGSTTSKLDSNNFLSKGKKIPNKSPN